MRIPCSQASGFLGELSGSIPLGTCKNRHSLEERPANCVGGAEVARFALGARLTARLAQGFLAAGGAHLGEILMDHSDAPIN